jgi:phage terminase Nu1 subunit (DNA packaging protein)
LIDAQIQLTHRVDTLTGDIAALNGRAAATDERLDRMAERVEAHDQQFGKIGAHLDQAVEAIKALAEAQARTDEQIRSLLDRNGSKPRPVAKSKKAAKKKGARTK